MRVKFKESFLLPAFCVKPTVATDNPIPREKLNPPTPSIYVSPHKPATNQCLNIIYKNCDRLMLHFYIQVLSTSLHDCPEFCRII